MRLLSIGTSPSVRKTRRYFSWFNAYVKASLSFSVPTSLSCCFRYTTKHLPVVLQPPDAERVFLLMKVLWVSLPPGRSPGSALWSGMKRTLSGLLLESWQVLHQSVCGHGPYSRTGIRSIIPEILLFQKHVSTWHKCCFLQHISWITIVLFYNEDVTYSSHYKGGFIWEIQSYHSMNWWKQFWSN